jgi:uncharacterized membrane protein
MESSRRFTRDGMAGGGGDTRRTVASFDNYADAERAVDHLSDRKFPVEHAAIVGRGLRFVEQVTGRMGTLEATLRGAATGALTGALIGWLFAIFDWFDPIVASGWLILDGLWFGALVGALAGLLAHAMTGGRRDFSSLAAMAAERYEVVVDEEFADEAERLLAEMTSRGAAAPETAAEPAAAERPASEPSATKQ